MAALVELEMKFEKIKNKGKVPITWRGQPAGPRVKKKTKNKYNKKKKKVKGA